MKRALALLILLAPSPALALDPVGAARMVAAPILGKLGWTGVYGGVNGGHMNFAQARGLVLSGAAPSGFATGLRIGGDVQIQNVVIGAFLDGSRGLGSQKAVDAGNLLAGAPMVERWSRPTSVSLNIRLGVPMGPVLLYSTTGYTWTTMNAAASVIRTVQGNPMRVMESYDASANGFNVGAGVEFRLVRTWSVYGEYRHTFAVRPSTLLSSGRIPEARTGSGQAAIGVNYRF